MRSNHIRLAIAAIAQLTQFTAKAQFGISNTAITDSADCTTECLALDDTFCQFSADKSKGRCCSSADLSCISQNEHGVCSNAYNLAGYKVFTCPFEVQACGWDSDLSLAQPLELTTIQSRSYFKKDKVCYYSIQAPDNAAAGDYIYLQMVGLSNTEAFITIAPQMTDSSPVYCAITAGTTLVARKPNKFFISFKSKVTDGSKFFLNSFYSPTLTADNYHNSQMCSDGGANVVSIPDNNGSSTGGTTTGETTTPTTDTTTGTTTPRTGETTVTPTPEPVPTPDIPETQQPYDAPAV